MTRSRSSSSRSPACSTSRRSQKGIRSGSPAASAFARASRKARSAASTAVERSAPPTVRGWTRSLATTTLLSGAAGGFDPKRRPSHDMRRVYAVARLSLSWEARRAPVHAVAKTAATTLHLEWTGDTDADRLISEDPTALLIGFCLDQQVPIEWAFQGPLRMREGLGNIHPAELGRIDPA